MTINVKSVTIRIHNLTEYWDGRRSTPPTHLFASLHTTSGFLEEFSMPARPNIKLRREVHPVGIIKLLFSGVLDVTFNASF